VEVALKIFREKDDWDACKVELKSLFKAGGHANVMEVLDFFEVPKPCMIMRLVRGGDLKDYLKKHGALKIDTAVRVLRGIAMGLQHLHSHGIVHRDMKSPNVLLQLPSMDPVLIDLGMGKMVGSAITHTKAIKGTLLWMAPEMITEKSSGKKIDIYALGIIMWEIFSGKVPFNEFDFDNIGEFIIQVCTKNKRPSIDVVRQTAGVKSGHVALIQKCWVKDPDSRPTATEFLQELKDCR
jgi:serine/threonine protein kinase